MLQPDMMADWKFGAPLNFHKMQFQFLNKTTTRGTLVGGAVGAADNQSSTKSSGQRGDPPPNRLALPVR